jgi:serine/threonine protein kinase
MRDAPGRRIAGKYELLERAGEGGMATVWRAVTIGAQGFERPIAFKRAHPALAADRDFVAMFVEEARVNATLDHPNIVHVHDFGEDEDGLHYLVMEWVEGLDLRALVHAHDLDDEHVEWPIVAAIGIEMLRGLHFAHTRVTEDGDLAPIFHRDVTPQNVMVAASGAVKITDFGLARAMDRARVTVPGVVKGKLSYLAPELTIDAPPSAKSDLFGVGIVLWEALAGQKLFDAPTDREVLGMVARADVPWIQDVRDDVSPEIAEIIHTALARDPGDRWLDARAMGNALARALRRLPDPVDADAIAEEVALARRRLGLVTARRSLADIEREEAERRAAVAAALLGPHGQADDPGGGAAPLPLTTKKRL